MSNQNYTYDDLKSTLLYSYNDYIDYDPVELEGIEEFTAYDRVMLKLETELKLNATESDTFEEAIVHTNLVNQSNPNYFYHTGYLHYLLCAWENDWGIEVGPWHLWNMFIWNIKEFYHIHFQVPNLIRPLTFPEIPTIKADTFNPNDVFSTLSAQIDKQVLSTLVLKFPNAPPFYLESIYGLLNESKEGTYIVDPMACSIPQVRRVGTTEEWISLIDTVGAVKQLYEGISTDLLNYLTKVETFFQDCCRELNNDTWWLSFFKVDDCSSGSEKSIQGHLTNLFALNVLRLNKLPQMISKLDFNLAYSNNVTKPGRYIAGVMSSQLDSNNILVPHFGYWTTSINLNVMDPKTRKFKTNLLEAFKFLEKCLQSIDYNQVHEYFFNEIYEKSDVTFGKVNVKDYAQELALTNKVIQPDMLSIEQEILHLQSRSEGKTMFDLLMDEYKSSKQRRNINGNFWFENYPIMNLAHSYITTEQWLEGRSRQSAELTEFVCDNLPLMMELLCGKCNDPELCHPYDVLQTYNENIYHAHIKWATSQGASLVKILAIIVRFLFTNYKISHNEPIPNFDPILSTRNPPHSLTTALYLCEQLMAPYDSEVKELVYDELETDVSQNISYEISLYEWIHLLQRTDRYKWLDKNINLLSNYAKCVLKKTIKNMGLCLNLLISNKFTLRFASTPPEHSKYIYPLGLLNENNQYVPLSPPVETFLIKLEHFSKEFKQHVAHPSALTDYNTHKAKQNYWYYNELFEVNPEIVITCVIEEEEFLKRLERTPFRIDQERWNNKAPLIEAFFENSLDHFNEIYKVLHSNDTNGDVFNNHIYWTFNLKIYKLFLDQYKIAPYQISSPIRYTRWFKGYFPKTINSFDELFPMLLLNLLHGDQILHNTCRSIDTNIGIALVNQLVKTYNSDVNRICAKLIKLLPDLVKGIFKPSDKTIKEWGFDAKQCETYARNMYAGPVGNVYDLIKLLLVECPPIQVNDQNMVLIIKKTTGLNALSSKEK